MIQDMKNGGTIIFNGDDDILRESGPIKGVEPVFFGTGDNSDFRATDIKPLGLKGTSCTLHMPNGTSFDCVVPLPGIHMVSNALAGAAVGYSLDLTNEEIKAGIENLPSIPGRNHIIITDKLTILDDCYNANPISTKAPLMFSIWQSDVKLLSLEIWVNLVQMKKNCTTRQAHMPLKKV